MFATETLAVGVNMPARSVVIEKLTKFTGDRHETLSPGQFTQLTGRAGRRGIDDRGAAIVLWSPFVRFDDVAELALSRSFHLRSAFRPTFNMVANLVRTYHRDRARQLLTLSFAQHQADRDIVRIERRLQRQRERLAELREAAASPFGDIDDYRRTHTDGGRTRGPIDEALAALRPGEVIHVDKGKHFGPAVVVATAHRSGGVKVTVITPSGRAMSLTADDFEAVVDPIGSVVLPGHYSPNRKDYRDEVGKRLKRAKLTGAKRRRGPAASGRHPVEADPDLWQRLEHARRADKTVAEIESLERRAEQRNSSLGREFDAVLAILDARGYVDAASWRLTERGDALSNLFHESDLLVCEALFAGVFDGLDDASVAGLVSCIVYEHRSPEDPPRPWFPDDDVRRPVGAVGRHQPAPGRRRAPQRARRAPATGPGVPGGRLRLGRWRGVRRDRRGGRPDRRRLRPDDQATRRSARPDRPHRREPGHPVGRTARSGIGAPRRGRRFIGGGAVTIRPGEVWGSEVPRPADLALATCDREIVEAAGPIGLAGGDVYRSLGSPPERDPVQRVELDGIEVELDDQRRMLGVAHVVARRAWWRGRVIACMNVDHLGAWNVAPRAHPGDGRIDIVECSPTMGARDRWAARGRLAAGTHVPHPEIEVARVTRRRWEFDRPHRVWIDGVEAGRARTLSVRCLQDRFTVLF